MPKTSSSKEKKKVAKEPKEKEEKKSALDEFEYGRLYATYCNSQEGLSHTDFVRLMKDLNINSVPETKPTINAEKEFNAGVLFAKYDTNQRGVIDREAFRNVVNEIHQSTITIPAVTTAVSRDVGVGNVSTSKFQPEIFQGDTFQREKIYYSSPLPHLTTLSGQFDDTATALLRRDYLHLQNLLEATLAPRIENEVGVLELLEEAKSKIKRMETGILEETETQVKAVVERLKKKSKEQCIKIDKIGSVHKKCLEKMSQFQYLAAGPRPRDALRLETLPTSQYAILHQAKESGYHREEDPTLEYYKCQREKAKSAFHDEGHAPHPVVMKDFVQLFADFQAGAQKITDAPYQYLNNPGYANVNPFEEAEKIVSEELPREISCNKLDSMETQSLKDQLKVKDQMIWKLVKERETFNLQKQQYANDIEELSTASQSEIKEWEDMYQTMKREYENKIQTLENRIQRR